MYVYIIYSYTQWSLKELCAVYETFYVYLHNTCNDACAIYIHGISCMELLIPWIPILCFTQLPAWTQQYNFTCNFYLYIVLPLT